MKKIILSIVSLALLLPFASRANDDRPISPDKLPAAAKAFIKETFPETPIVYAEIDKEITKTKYEVRLNDGTKIEFNGKGEWDKVECIRKAVPASLVPEVIVGYVQTTFPDNLIVKIDKERFGWSIELSNDLELDFSPEGALLRIDD
ncbi:MAG: PepSY-like domain-containing protein [Bacteroidales bacterium]|nr:PepSY-like domain-containing protein [Bacteroidales bacterium]